MSPERDDPAPTEATAPSVLSHAHGRFLPGSVLANRYRIVALAGRGGMGEVYRADDLKIGQPVALKFLPADFERNPDRLERLLGEVRIARQVSHPNVCRVYDVGEFEGHHFITMEYVDGEDLALLLRRIGRLPQEKALDLTRQIAAGLAAAHVQGIVHRDLKPANIMLDGRGRARITDFGLAAAAEALRGKETQWGTPGYMAPEQLTGQEITPRTDIYALGLVLYEMFSGKRPFDEAAKPESGAAAGGVPARLTSIVPGLDPAVDAAVLKCLEKEPVRRPSSAVELLAALPGGDPLAEALRAGETPSPEMVAAAGEEGQLSSPKAWGLFGLAILAVGAAIFLTARLSGLDQVPVPLGPELLRERAHGIARQLGDEVPARFDAWWFDLDEGYPEWALNRSRAPSLADARPSALRFNYRQSPRQIVPDFGFVTPRGPALAWSGEAYVSTDPQGHLLEFSQLDRQVASPNSVPPSAADWSALLALTGANISGLRPVEPLWTPDVPCDARAAWVGGAGIESIRFEAAAWRGKPVWFRTIAPWERAERDAAVPSRDEAGFGVFLLVVLATLVVFGVLARHNLRLGRSDSRGAIRVGVAVFLAFAIGGALIHRWALDAFQLWRWLVRLSYFAGLAAWLYYLGIEPFLRRRWPHRLIAWTRLLEGRFADPLVGKDVLLGVLAGAGIVLSSCIPAVVEQRHDVALLRLALPFGPAVWFWGAASAGVGDALMKGLGSFAVLLLLRVLLRRDAAAWVGLVLLWMLISLPSGNVSVVQWIDIAVEATCFVLAVRVGLLAAVVAAGTVGLLAICTPLTLDFSRWYAWRTGVVAVLLLAIIIWGFRAVMGRRKILSAAILEG